MKLLITKVEPSETGAEAYVTFRRPLDIKEKLYNMAQFFTALGPPKYKLGKTATIQLDEITIRDNNINEGEYITDIYDISYSIEVLESDNLDLFEQEGVTPTPKLNLLTNKPMLSLYNKPIYMATILAAETNQDNLYDS